MAENPLVKFLSGLKLWQRGGQSVVGIDIGSSSVKIAQLRKSGERAVLETYGELALGSYSKKFAGQTVLLPEEKIVELLKDLFKESGVTAKRAVVAIPIKNGFMIVVKLFAVDDDKNISEMVQFEARKFIPVPLSEVELNWWVLGKKNDTEKMAEILVSAIHKDVIQKYRSIVSRAGVEVDSIEIEIFSLWRSCLLHQITPVMIMDLGASVSKMSIMEKGMVKASHMMDRGSQLATNAIANSLKVGFERAEEIKREIGLSPLPEYTELNSVVASVLDLIFSDAKQFMLNYQRTYQSSISRVILTGGGSLVPGIVDLAVKRFGIEVVLADPFARIEHPVFLQDTLKEIGPLFSVAVGLALKAL